MLGHDLYFVGRPSGPGKGLVPGCHEEETLVRHDTLAVRQLKHELSLSHLRAHLVPPDAGLFLKLSDCGLLECLTILDGAARRGPVVLPGERSRLVNEPKEKNSSDRVQNEQPGGWTAAHI